MIHLIIGDFHEIWYGWYVIGDYSKITLCACVITSSALKVISGDDCSYAYNDFRMAGRIFIRFIMPLESRPKSSFLISYNR
jgi:hypothetical protein